MVNGIVIKTDNKDSNETNLGYLDALKGLAILAVTMVHSIGADLPGVWGKIGSEGARGVQMFFIISGILAFRSLKNSFPNGKLTIKDVGKWYLKKYIRIAPLYYFAIVVSMLTGSFNMYWLGAEGHVTIKNILAHVFLVHGLFPHYTDSILAVEWYLGVLWLFYLITPFLFRLVNSLEKAIIFAIIVFIVNPQLNYGLGLLLPNNPDPYIYNEYIVNFGPFSQFLVYSFGIVLFFLIEKIKDRKTKYSRILSYALFLFALIIVFGQVIVGGKLFGFSKYEIFGLLFAIIIISQVVYPSKLVCNPAFRLIGRYSYGIYLFQFIWLHFYDLFIHYTGKYEWIVKYSISLAALFVISFILTEFYEKPIRNKLIKNIFENNRA